MQDVTKTNGKMQSSAAELKFDNIQRQQQQQNTLISTFEYAKTKTDLLDRK